MACRCLVGQRHLAVAAVVVEFDSGMVASDADAGEVGTWACRNSGRALPASRCCRRNVWLVELRPLDCAGGDCGGR